MSDKFNSSVAARISFDGANNSTVFTDTGPSARTITTVGNTKVSTAQSKFGGASGLFDGNGDYLTMPDSSGWVLGTGDFTLECWIRPTSIAYIPLFAQIPNMASGDNRVMFGWWLSQWHFYCRTTTDQVVININDDFFNSFGASGLWFHVAFTRNGNTFRLFRNGVLIGTATSSASFADIASIAYIGLNNITAIQRYYDGYMDEWRMTVGVCRYTANFALPQGPWNTSKRTGTIGGFAQPVISLY